MKKTTPLDLIRTQVWINFLLNDLNISADQLENLLHPHKKHSTNTIYRWSKGLVKPNVVSADKINKKFPQAQRIYDLAIWTLLDDSIKKAEVLTGEAVIKKINAECLSESIFACSFLRSLYELRRVEVRNDPYLHYINMRHCLTYFPFYFSKNLFLEYVPQLAFLLYRCSWKMPATESRIMPDYDLLSYFTENISEYDLDKPDRPYVYLTDFLGENNEHSGLFF